MPFPWPGAAIGGSAAELARLARQPLVRTSGMKKLLELVLCFFHPAGVILMGITLTSRRDLTGGAKLAWGIRGPGQERIHQR
jgi:hypothetical protein